MCRCTDLIACSRNNETASFMLYLEKMSRQLILALALQTIAHCTVISKGHNVGAWSLAQFSSLITFGDSYTDENRLNYFIQHGATAPPAGTFLPEVRLPSFTPEMHTNML